LSDAHCGSATRPSQRSSHEDKACYRARAQSAPFMSSAMEDTLEAEGVPERQLKKTKKRPVA
jgi:hypothetical protein